MSTGNGTDTDPLKPSGLNRRAEKLWEGVLKEVKLDSAGLAILEDACRTVDIIDRLSGALKSKNQEWMRLADEAVDLAHDAVEIHIVVNPLLGEIRQQRMALKGLLAQLKLGNVTPKSENDLHKDLFTRLEEEFSGS